MLFGGLPAKMLKTPPLRTADAGLHRRGHAAGDDDRVGAQTIGPRLHLGHHVLNHRIDNVVGAEIAGHLPAPGVGLADENVRSARGAAEADQVSQADGPGAENDHGVAQADLGSGRCR